jgi:hypothetical protein
MAVRRAQSSGTSAPAGLQAQLHLTGDHAGGQVVAVAALAVPVAVSLAAVAWLQQTANGLAGDSAWLYLGSGLALLTLLLPDSLPVAVTDSLLALVVVLLVVHDTLSRVRVGPVTPSR